MLPSRLQELRAAWLTLALLLALAVPARSPLVLALILLPWLAGGAFLLGRGTGPSVAAAAVRLACDRVDRMNLLVAAGLLGFVALLATPFVAFLVATWGAAAGMAIALAAGSEVLRGIWQRVVMLGAATALVCLGLEGILRLPPLEQRFGSPGLMKEWERRYDQVGRRNVFGFRTRHETLARSSRVRRVLAMGDSFTWGQYVASSDSIWPSRLEAELTRSAPDRPTEVVNISRAGWSTVDEVIMLERVGWQFQPDRVLIQFFNNDTDPPEANTRVVPQRPASLSAAIAGGLLPSSTLLWVVRRAYTLTLGQPAHREALFRSYEDGSEGWERVQTGLRRVATSARDREIPVTLVLFPTFIPGEWTPDTYPLRPIYRKVARAARAEGLEVLDLVEAYAAEGGNWRRWWATPFDRHPSAEAHAVAARAVARYLAGRGWGIAARTEAGVAPTARATGRTHPGVGRETTSTRRTNPVSH